MRINSIQIDNFRNLISQKIELSPNVNLILGDNAQGKTNLLESIYFLLNGESFRPGKRDHLIQHYEQGFSIFTETEKKNYKENLSCYYGHDKKVVRLNQKNTSFTNIKSKFRCVLFNPESLLTIKSGPESRRALIDDFIQTFYEDGRLLYRELQRTIKSRNKVLKDYKREQISRKQAVDILESLNPIYVSKAVKWTMLRLAVLAESTPQIQQTYQHMTGTKQLITAKYIVSDKDFTHASEEEVYYQMLDRQKELFDRELNSGITLVGPHKHEVSFFIDDIDTRFYASQGQQRALILAFKMAQAELITKKFGEEPLLLLDDVMSELDPQKRLFLIDFLSKIDAQIVLTTTDLAYSRHFEKGDQLYQFNLKNGVITRVRTICDRDESRDGQNDRNNNNKPA